MRQSTNAANTEPGALDQTRDFVLSVNTAQAEKAPATKQALHGHVSGIKGADSLISSDILSPALPVAQDSSALGADLSDGRTSFALSYDRFSVNRELLLVQLANQVSTWAAGNPLPANFLTSNSLAFGVNHLFGRDNLASFRYARSEMNGNSLQNGQDAILPGVAKGLNTSQTTLSAANSRSTSGSAGSETTAHFSTTTVQLPPGAMGSGLQLSLTTERRSRVFQAAENIYRQVGSQSVRMGGDFFYNQMTITLLQSSMGRISNAGPSLRQAEQDTGLYVQSARQVGSSVLLTSGMRYDLPSMRGFKKDLNNFSPQPGLAWSPGSSHTVLRAGIGMSYISRSLPSFAASSDASAMGNLADTVTFSGLQQASFSSYGSFTAGNPASQSAYAEHANFEAEQQIGRKSVLSAQYQYVRSVQLALPAHRQIALCGSSVAFESGNHFNGQQIGTGAST